MDQVAAKHAADQTPLPSLELAIDPVSIGVDRNVGYTRVYGSHIAWSGPTRPLAREINPRIAFERLFRVSQPPSAEDRRDVILLDKVLGDTKKLRQRVGAADRRRMDEYLESVRALEKRLIRAEQSSQQPWQPRAKLSLESKPDDEPRAHVEHVRMMLDIIALAFQTDSTRVCSFMFGNSVSGKSFSFLDGVKGGHHDISHHQRKEDKLRQYERIARWHIEQYAYLLQKLSKMKEEDATVLESSMILFGSGLRDGNSHNPHNLPIIVGGRGNGRLATGQHLVFRRDTPLSNLYLCLLEAFGTPQDRFADSTGRLGGVLV